MSADLGMLAAILSVAVLLFVTEWVRVDVVAILVLVFLALTGLVGPEEALAGFSNSAVVTVWAVFILSGGLMRTGVANLLGQWVLRLAGDGETRLLVLIMIVAAVLSAFMNNVGVAALLLPVVMDIARRTGRSPGRLLMPLAYACLMGGSLTLIGTPPNLLVNEALLQAGLPGFRLFDFTLPGLAINAAGITAVVVLRRFLLPARDGAGTAATSTDLGHFYGLEERLQRVRVPADSPLAGKTIAESQIGTALELTVIGIWRNGRNMLAPHIDTVIVAGDELLVSGPRRHLRAFVAPDYLAVLAEPVVETTLAQLADRVVVARVEEGSRLVGQTVPAAGFRDRLGLNVLALWRHGERVTARLVDSPLRAGDRLVLHGEPDRIAAAAGAGLAVEGSGADVAYRLESHLIQASVPADSPLVGQTLAESRFGDAFDLTVLALDRDGEITLDPGSTLPLAAGDRLIIQGEPAALSSLEAMRSLSPLPSAGFALPTIQSDAVGLMEVMLSPHSQLGGQTLRELSFRAKYDLSVLAIWRAGRAYQENLPDMPLRFGDALLVFGQREKLLILGREPDFLVLTEDATEPPRSERAPIAAIIMAITVLAVLLGVAPLSIAALAASAAMVLTGCLTMEEAYRFIDWKAVFLIAGMVPLGTALQTTGAARLVAEQLVAQVGAAGPMVLVIGLFALAATASLFLPNAVAALIIAPIALDAAIGLGVSPYSALLAVAVGTSNSFLTPVGHPANVLVMGPGGYRFTDYIRLGLPLLLVVLAALLLVLPLTWPL